MTPAESWGRRPLPAALRETRLYDRHAELPSALNERGLLVHGLGRSYGDQGLNPGGHLLHARGLDRFIHFDADLGVVRAEAGVSLAEVLALVMPRGWFLAVVPGTRHVTLGGAVANDVHGKNHERDGSFGRWVRALELLRSDGQRIACSPTVEAHWFGATVGGMGLTGCITWVEVQLVRPIGLAVQVHSTRFDSLEDYLACEDRFTPENPFRVAWLDARGRGRGILSTGRFTEPMPGVDLRLPRQGPQIPCPTLPVVCAPVISAFNEAYFRRPVAAVATVSPAGFFFPLDGVRGWNRLYGRRGFYQYQCVLPMAEAAAAGREMFSCIDRSGQRAGLAVAKRFGALGGAGMMSFPRPGLTLALDFADGGSATTRLFDTFDAIVRTARGALYPAKDARMDREMFLMSFPAVDSFANRVDPAFSSALWRRVRA